MEHHKVVINETESLLVEGRHIIIKSINSVENEEAFLLKTEGSFCKFIYSWHQFRDSFSEIQNSVGFYINFNFVRFLTPPCIRDNIFSIRGKLIHLIEYADEGLPSWHIIVAHTIVLLIR